MRPATLALCLVALIGAPPPPALLQAVPSDDPAVAAFLRGRDAFKRQDFTLATTEFNASYAQRQHPLTAYFVSLAYFKVLDLMNAERWATAALVPVQGYALDARYVKGAQDIINYARVKLAPSPPAPQSSGGIGMSASGIQQPPVPPVPSEVPEPVPAGGGGGGIPAVSGQPTYPLVCHGGGDMHFLYTPFSNLSPRPQIWITFVGGPQGVGPQWENLGSLQPGECSWLDRTLAGNEPRTIALLNVDNFSIQWQRGQVTGIGSDLPHIGALQTAGRYQSFEVYNNGKGYFVVTRIGPSR